MDNTDQPVYYSDGITPVRRSSPDELFLFTIEARPGPDSDERGGAFVNCWVDTDDLGTAERRAVALILGDGWRPHRFDGWSLVTRATYDGREPDLLEIVEQAFADGEVAVFNIWPADAPDADDTA